MIWHPLEPDDTPNAICEKFIFHSCLYYKFSATSISDSDYDKISRKLAEVFDQVTCERKKWIDREGLDKCSSGYYIEYPQQVIMCAEECIRKGIAKI